LHSSGDRKLGEVTHEYREEVVIAERGVGGVAIPFVVVSRGLKMSKSSFGGGVIDGLA